LKNSGIEKLKTKQLHWEK